MVYTTELWILGAWKSQLASKISNFLFLAPFHVSQRTATLPFFLRKIRIFGETNGNYIQRRKYCSECRVGKMRIGDWFFYIFNITGNIKKIAKERKKLFGHQKYGFLLPFTEYALIANSCVMVSWDPLRFQIKLVCSRHYKTIRTLWTLIECFLHRPYFNLSSQVFTRSEATARPHSGISSELR